MGARGRQEKKKNSRRRRGIHRAKQWKQQAELGGRPWHCAYICTCTCMSKAGSWNWNWNRDQGSYPTLAT